MDRIAPPTSDLERYELLERVTPAYGVEAHRARDRARGDEVHLERLARWSDALDRDAVLARTLPPQLSEPRAYALPRDAGLDADGAPWVAWEYAGPPACAFFASREAAVPLPRERAWPLLDVAARALVSASEARRISGSFRADALRSRGPGHALYLWLAPLDEGEHEPTRDLQGLAWLAFALLTGRAHPRAHPRDADLLERLTASDDEPPQVTAEKLGASASLPAGFDAWFLRCTVPARAYFSVREAHEALRYLLAPGAPAFDGAPPVSRAELLLATEQYPSPQPTIYGGPAMPLGPALRDGPFPVPAYGGPSALGPHHRPLAPLVVGAVLVLGAVSLVATLVLRC